MIGGPLGEMSSVTVRPTGLCGGVTPRYRTLTTVRSANASAGIPTMAQTMIDDRIVALFEQFITHPSRLSASFCANSPPARDASWQEADRRPDQTPPNAK